jgi:hypothetical protein
MLILVAREDAEVRLHSLGHYLRGKLHYVPPKRRFLQEPHGVTYQKTQFFIVTAVKTSNLTNCIVVYK